MKNTIAFILLVSMAGLPCCVAQDMDPLVLTDDARYFDFWEGTWVGLKDDNSLDTSIYFTVRRSVHPASFMENWGDNSFALRAWDKTNKKWGFVWISANGLYQVWDTRKYDGHWFIVREFSINGDRYLSRQGFLPQSDGTVLRVSEKSYDEKKWEVRFKQRLRKIRK
jgi:hypothetical protein